jgi:uncharacterized repeat protein (TIGR01451 family)
MIDHRRQRRLVPAALLTTLVLALQMGFAALARADGGDFKLDFASATPGTYDQTTGTGGTWADVVQQLEGGDFTCGDIVQHLTEVVVDDGATGTQDIEITYSFDTETTSGGQVGYGDVTYASINDDPANQLSGNETVTLTSVETVGEEIIATVSVTGLEAGEVLIVSVGAQLVCNEDPANVTGNVHATLESAQTSEGDPINTGNDDTPLINISELAAPPPVPGIEVTKECPSKVVAGSVVSVTITIENTGEETLTDITVTDSIGGDLSDSFADTLDPGESDSQTFSVPTDPDAPTHDVTDTVSVSGTGSESTVTATDADSCTTTIEAPLPPTGFSGAGGVSAAWLFVLATLVLLTGIGMRYAARRRG